MILKLKINHLQNKNLLGGGRKLWNENLVAIQGDNYWFTLNPIFDFRVGKDTESQASSTFVNTRGVIVNGD